MITAMDRKLPGRIGKNSLFNIFYMGPVHPYRNIVFTLTGNGAGVAANTQTVIYHKSVIHTIIIIESI